MSAHDWMRNNLATVLGIDAYRVTHNARLDEDLGADSLDLLELVMTAEDHFQIRVADAELKDISTFGEAVALVDRKRVTA